jgi:queuine tRNA-ribosyltransferase
MKQAVKFAAPLLPQDRPRYLMGVGLPEDLIAAVGLGMDMFDCVIPTRFARNATLFTRTGKLRIKDKSYRKDRYPIDTKCGCYTCRTHPRMVLRYMFHIGDPIAETLATIHNLTFYQDLMRDMRQAIGEGRFYRFAEAWLGTYLKKKG